MGNHFADETATSRGNGELGVCSEVSSHHKRSKSASDRSLGSSELGISHTMGKDLIGPQDLQKIVKSHGTQVPVHPDFVEAAKNTSSNHRVSLEKDIEQLQLCLHQERSMRNMLDRAMGRASSTLSPGHRHFASQTRELIAEIELLEEEVTNREMHILSLYRSIFDQHVTRPPSVKSSVMSSSAHAKNGVRKHPSIISSAFCSSKKFPLFPFQVTTSAKDSRRKDTAMLYKTRNSSLFDGKTNRQTESHCQDSPEVQAKIPVIRKGSFARTLKDHLNQCPSKLSEELVKCMAAIYCSQTGAASQKPEKSGSPLLSRSSTEVRPSPVIGDVQYWSCKSIVELSWIPTNSSHFLQASDAINHFGVLVKQLETVHTSRMDKDAKLAFWINVYNSLVMRAYLAYGIPQSSLRRMALFHKAALNIGGHFLSANAIEHSILCCRMPRTGRWFETIISTAMRKKSGEERQLLGPRYGVMDSQPLVCFALCSGAQSDPTLKVYTAKNVKGELEIAKKEFLEANVVVSKSMKVFLPKILGRYAKEASISLEDLLPWVCENVDKKLQESIRKCMDCKSKRKASQIIEWLPYNSRFRYVLATDLTVTLC